MKDQKTQSWIVTIVTVAVVCVICEAAFFGNAGVIRQLLGSAEQPPVSREPNPPPVERIREANDVESLLKAGKWLAETGFSAGLKWKFADGNRVLIYDADGEVDESYRWEVLSRNENTRSIKIKYWRPAEQEYREWTFRFTDDGKSATVEKFRKSNGVTEMVGNTTMSNRE